MIQRRPLLAGAIAISTGAGAVIFAYLIAYLIAERVQ
jgi:phage shock protein PspC (stress-responsive transcriptional regulator)